jgi:phosphoribosylaminoimidazolecarboxamide formyltransferase/IMP cyclohydrolase
MSINVVERVDDLVKVQNILVSVSDKGGLEQFIPELVEINPEIRIFKAIWDF